MKEKEEIGDNEKVRADKGKRQAESKGQSIIIPSPMTLTYAFVVWLNCSGVLYPSATARKGSNEDSIDHCRSCSASPPVGRSRRKTGNASTRLIKGDESDISHFGLHERMLPQVT